MAGISRSVTLVLAYLMKHHNMTYDQAFQTVRRKRKIVLIYLLRSIQIEALSDSSNNTNENYKMKNKPCEEAMTISNRTDSITR